MFDRLGMTSRVLIALSLWLFGVALSQSQAASSVVETPHAEIRLQASKSTIAPGETIWVRLAFDLIPHWHVYWRNPGDSGEPPRISWQLPAGWQAGEIHWPVPERIRVGPLVNYGYEDHVDFLVPLTAPQELTADRAVSIAADASWLVCEQECIPEQGSFSLSLSSTAIPTDSSPAAWLETAKAQWPRPFRGKVRYIADKDGSLTLYITAPDWPIERVPSLWFAANDWGPVSSSGEQSWLREGDDLVIRLPAGDMPLQADQPLHGLLVVEEDVGDESITQGFELEATPGTAPVADDASPTLWLAIGFALLGGLILNLMPCVLPVLSIKVLGLIGHANGNARRHGLAFFGGVLATFAMLAGLLLALRSAGSHLGWGFQLQEPIVVIGLMYLMLALGLNLSGVFAMGTRLMGIGDNLTSARGLSGSVATGALAVIVATPCTAPFMGTALGFAMTQSAGEAMTVFIALGVGFGLPVLVLSAWPTLLKRVPAPGPWMERLRNVLAFPMYGAALWLLWVVSQQVDAQALARVLAGALMLAFALWWIGLSVSRWPQRGLAFAVLLGAIALGAAAGPGSTTGPADPAMDAWSPTRVSEIQGDGKPVFVNFTAA